MTMAEFNEKINQLIYAKDEEECRKIAAEAGVTLRVREYIE